MLGYTPYTVQFAYVPLFIGSIYLATLKAKNYWKIALITALLVLTADLILDPAAAALNFWIYTDQGIFLWCSTYELCRWILTGFSAL